MEIKSIWQDVLQVLQKKMSAVSYEIWIKNLVPYSLSGSTLILVSPLQNNRKVIESTHRRVILESIGEASPFITDFLVTTEEELPALSLDAKESARRDAKSGSNVAPAPDVLLFNKFYTFESFVIGGSNQIAYHAAKSVAENPGGNLHNPLFIYGGVGLGKTHIMQAIGNYLAKKRPEVRILYITANSFVDDFIDSLKDGGSRDGAKNFRMKYRQNIDVLMIDDIQILENKGASQDALFNTFNDLYQHGKQLVFTSDRHPKEIKGINERLISRFQSGLTVDISKPDLETRVAILKKKADYRKFTLSKAVAEYIAEKIDTNVRELEGALNKVVYYCGLTGKSADSVDAVADALKDYIDPRGGELSMDSVANVTANYFNIAKSELLGKKKTKNLVEPRQIAIYIIGELLTHPLSAVGEFFGGRDHTTVLYARGKISKQIKTDSVLERKVDEIKKILLNGRGK